MTNESPTVVLIGGPGGAGKTTLGRALAIELGWTSLTVDDVMMAARAITSPESHPALFPMRRAGGHVPYFTAARPEQLVADALTQEEASWPMVDAVIRRHLAQHSPIVIDWWLLRPSTLASACSPGVAPVFLHPDPELLWRRERANTFTHESDDPERMLQHFMHRSLWRNELVAGEAREHGFPVFDLSGSESVDELVERAIEVTGALRRGGPTADE